MVALLGLVKNRRLKFAVSALNRALGSSVASALIKPGLAVAGPDNVDGNPPIFGPEMPVAACSTSVPWANGGRQM